MYELAKKSRENMKSKARRLAGGKDQKVDSSDWSPAPPLRADMKTGARPVTKPSAKGIGESNKAADTKSALGSAHRGAFKDGGGVLDKKALGAIDPRAKRAAAQNYKKGGKVAQRKGKDLGGVAEVLSPAYALIRALQRGGKDEERDTANRLQGAEMANANAARKKGGKVVKRDARATGGRAKGKPSISINILAGSKSPAPGADATPMVPPRMPPAPMPQMQGPPPGAVPPAPMPNVDPRNIQTPAARQAPIGLKTGGRATKVAKSYKDMEASAANGEGRLQKTDIAKLRKDAPARKDGGRISKVAKSYKDMTSSAANGEGRLQKTDIAKAKKGRAA